MRLLWLLTMGCVCICMAAHAQKEPIERQWYNEDKSAKVLIYRTVQQKYAARIVWLKEPLKNGKPQTDEHNANPARRNDPCMGMFILTDFEKKNNHCYHKGKVYNPHDGKAYDGILTLQGNKLLIRGYVMSPIFGKTIVFTKTEDPD
jgi:uncharacterized protein (DUF2147 family)